MGNPSFLALEKSSFCEKTVIAVGNLYSVKQGERKEKLRAAAQRNRKTGVSQMKTAPDDPAPWYRPLNSID
jgi:hypothetical protein